MFIVFKYCGFIKCYFHFALISDLTNEKKLGSDYFTENFQLKENKTRMRNIHPHFFHLLF